MTLAAAMTTGDGAVTEEEFIQAFMAKWGGTKEKGKRVFDKLDRDGDKSLSMAELSAFFKSMDKDGKRIEADRQHIPGFVDSWMCVWGDACECTTQKFNQCTGCIAYFYMFIFKQNSVCGLCTL